MLKAIEETERAATELRAIIADLHRSVAGAWCCTSADECQAGIEGMSRIMTSIEVRKVFDAGPDVLTWFELSTSVADTVPVANWMHVEDGKITQIRVAFDARGIAPGS